MSLLLLLKRAKNLADIKADTELYRLLMANASETELGALGLRPEPPQQPIEATLQYLQSESMLREAYTHNQRIDLTTLLQKPRSTHSIIGLNRWVLPILKLLDQEKLLVVQPNIKLETYPEFTTWLQTTLPNLASTLQLQNAADSCAWDTQALVHGRTINAEAWRHNLPLWLNPAARDVLRTKLIKATAALAKAKDALNTPEKRKGYQHKSMYYTFLNDLLELNDASDAEVPDLLINMVFKTTAIENDKNLRHEAVSPALLMSWDSQIHLATTACWTCGVIVYQRFKQLPEVDQLLCLQQLRTKWLSVYPDDDAVSYLYLDLCVQYLHDHSLRFDTAEFTLPPMLALAERDALITRGYKSCVDTLAKRLPNAFTAASLRELPAYLEFMKVNLNKGSYEPDYVQHLAALRVALLNYIAPKPEAPSMAKLDKLEM